MKTHNILLAASLALALAGCKKQEDQTPQVDQKTTEDITTSMTINEEMNTLTEMSLEGDPKKKASTTWSGCATFSIDTTGPTNVVTLDFGTTNCQGGDGKYRRGKLIITFEDNPFDAGSIYTVTSQGYAVNDFEVNGSKTITLKGLNANNDPWSTVNTNLQIIKPTGDTITWNSSQQRVWVDGFGDLDPYDNAVEITGTASGTTGSGIAYNVNVTKALRVEATCSNIVSGTLEISGPTFATRTIDYGNGSCDNQATLTVNGNTINITLN